VLVKPRVYTDTSVLGGCEDEEFREPSRRLLEAFDCVESMRQVRDKLSAEIADMNHDELVQWLRRHRYEDPILQQLADKAALQADAADRLWPGGRLKAV